MLFGSERRQEHIFCCQIRRRYFAFLMSMVVVLIPIGNCPSDYIYYPKILLSIEGKYLIDLNLMY